MAWLFQHLRLAALLLALALLALSAGLHFGLGWGWFWSTAPIWIVVPALAIVAGFLLWLLSLTDIG